MVEEMHPSGMPLSRWHDPFKTEQERELVIKWNKRQAKQDKQQQLDNIEEAPF